MAGKEVPAKGKDKCKKPESPSACNDPVAGHPERKGGRYLPEGADSVALSMEQRVRAGERVGLCHHGGL